ncbi:MAG TPA: hypothetical protein VEC12_12900 [Bacteroidia bacterium]|nr:hypothetical protein [Bacteroidia bacterium]
MKKIFLLFIVAASVVGCKKNNDSEPGSRVVLKIDRLEDLGPNAQYEGWIIVNGVPKSTGRFTVNSAGELSQTTFDVDASDLNAAKTFVLTVEPMPDPDAGPGNVKLLAGDFTVNVADINTSHPGALGNNFGGITGKYLLATPTTASAADEKSGVWFMDGGTQTPGLQNLPILPVGWQYEGWVVINGIPVTTGKFVSAGGADNNAPYSGLLPGFPFPGEDFVQNAPAGLTFPTDLTGNKMFVSIEPVPNNSSAPFLLKPLEATVPNPSAAMVNYPMNNIAAGSFPAGTVTR